MMIFHLTITVSTASVVSLTASDMWPTSSTMVRCSFFALYTRRSTCPVTPMTTAPIRTPSSTQASVLISKELSPQSTQDTPRLAHPGVQTSQYGPMWPGMQRSSDESMIRPPAQVRLPPWHSRTSVEFALTRQNPESILMLAGPEATSEIAGALDTTMASTTRPSLAISLTSSPPDTAVLMDEATAAATASGTMILKSTSREAATRRRRTVVSLAPWMTMSEVSTEAC
mmetsp:Transcript_595/g.1423  ORF Transcript_595/g.1423 Transcript_595/m.1423 type:complete len:228 (+) Transcript_595:2381-3064(+)